MGPSEVWMMAASVGPVMRETLTFQDQVLSERMPSCGLQLAALETAASPLTERIWASKYRLNRKPLPCPSQQRLALSLVA